MTWYVEEGIGEQRAILVDGGEIRGARVEWPGSLAAGQIEDAVLVSKARGSARGTARFASGEQALVDRLPGDASEGATLRLEVTRAAIAEAGRGKLAHARLTAEAPAPPRTLAAALASEGHEILQVQSFTHDSWDDLIAEAFARNVPFDGGMLLLSPTPAMTLIDIDGALPPRLLALAAVPAIAATLRRLDIAGSIGIDFPTLPNKADRRAVDQALAAALAGWPHERTAMNGFGFVQLVARLTRPSILQRVAHDPAGAAARLLLRRAERVADPGAILLACHPAVKACLREEWLAELARRTGREIRVEADPGLALPAGFAQAVAR
ncbi:MAG TPA: ribonuclease E/G [Sphingomonadaceae bacterium]